MKAIQSESSKIRKVVLVYQGGIANVFRVQCFNADPFGREANRLVQADFRTCETYAAALAYAGFQVATMHCNQAGDVINSKWSENLEEAPFSDQFRPVWSKVNGYQLFRKTISA